MNSSTLACRPVLFWVELKKKTLSIGQQQKSLSNPLEIFWQILIKRRFHLFPSVFSETTYKRENCPQNVKRPNIRPKEGIEKAFWLITSSFGLRKLHFRSREVIITFPSKWGRFFGSCDYTVSGRKTCTYASDLF